MDGESLDVLPPEIREMIYKYLVKSSVMNNELKKELYTGWILMQIKIIGREALKKDYNKAILRLKKLIVDTIYRDDISDEIKTDINTNLEYARKQITSYVSDIWAVELKDPTFDDINAMINSVLEKDNCFMCYTHYNQTRFVTGYSRQPYTCPVVRGYLFFDQPVGSYIISKIVKRCYVKKIRASINEIKNDLQSQCYVLFQVGNMDIRSDLDELD